jgi:hypothetical protein
MAVSIALCTPLNLTPFELTDKNDSEDESFLTEITPLETCNPSAYSVSAKNFETSTLTNE